MSASPEKSSRLERALQLFDAANAEDPHIESANGKAWPREQLYSARLHSWVTRLVDAPSEPLLLAAHCQHLRRWKIPRGSFPATRAGYLRWRADLKKFHAAESAAILRDCGYDEVTIAAVQALNLKSNFPTDPDSRVLEDALCLVFLEFQFEELASRTSDEKMINALRKSWGKMSVSARQYALKLQYSAKCSDLIRQALQEVS
jgi:hypothetical protein